MPPAPVAAVPLLLPLKRGLVPYPGLVNAIKDVGRFPSYYASSALQAAYSRPSVASGPLYRRRTSTASSLLVLNLYANCRRDNVLFERPVDFTHRSTCPVDLACSSRIVLIDLLQAQPPCRSQGRQVRTAIHRNCPGRDQAAPATHHIIHTTRATYSR